MNYSTLKRSISSPYLLYLGMMEVSEEDNDLVTEINPLGRKIPPLNRQARWINIRISVWFSVSLWVWKISLLIIHSKNYINVFKTNYIITVDILKLGRNLEFSAKNGLDATLDVGVRHSNIRPCSLLGNVLSESNDLTLFLKLPVFKTGQIVIKLIHHPSASYGHNVPLNWKPPIKSGFLPTWSPSHYRLTW